MGYLSQKQLKYYSDLSTGLISLDGDLSSLITINDFLPVVSATRIDANTVEFEITNHAQYNTAIGKFFSSTGFTPVAYDITGTILSITDADHFRVTSLSDPVGNATVIGLWDAGSLNINHNGKYRNLKRPSLYRPQSTMLFFVAKNNIDHSAIGTDGNFSIVVDDTETISIIQLPTGIAKLEAFLGAGVPNFNTHLELGTFFKDAGVVGGFTPVAFWNGNIHNRFRYSADTIGVLNNTQDVDFTGGDLTLIYRAGFIFSTDVGFADTGGVSNEQNILTSDVNAPLILTVTRDNIIQDISVDVNVTDFESPVGTLTPLGVARAGNRFMLGFVDPNFPGGGFLVNLLGQMPFPGATRVQDAANSTEPLDNPNLTKLGSRLIKISVDVNEVDLNNAIKTKLEKFN